MTTEMILNSIARWQDVIKNSEELVSYFDQGNSFTYHKEEEEYDEPYDFMHAYPGIYEGKLIIFLIPNAYDKEEYKEDISKFTQVCPVFWTMEGTLPVASHKLAGGTHTLPDEEAQIRIKMWEQCYKDWAPKQVTSPVGMFKAFNIPADDFRSEECLGIFGLKKDGNEGAIIADMIIANTISEAVVEYDDFVNPVPPFGANALEESFYLLEAIKLD